MFEPVPDELRIGGFAAGVHDILPFYQLAVLLLSAKSIYRSDAFGSHLSGHFRDFDASSGGPFVRPGRRYRC